MSSTETHRLRAAAKAQYERERRAQNAAAAAAAADSASSPASSSPAAASPAAASPGAGVDIRSLEDEDGYHIGDLLQQTHTNRADVKARMAAATVAKKAKAAAKRAEAALPAPGTRRSPACCSRFPLLALI